MTKITALQRLEQWFAAQCDGDWEHASGVTIDTLDNPGWRSSVDLAGTGLEQHQLELHELRRDAHNWLIVWRDGSAYKSACGPLNLSDAIERFLEWAERGAARQPNP
jgi:hypothetical protein